MLNYFRSCSGCVCITDYLSILLQGYYQNPYFMKTTINRSNILFNALKHSFVEQLNLVGTQDKAVFYASLLKLGGSQMDVYEGRLSVDCFFSECVEALTDLGIRNRTEYIVALEKGNGYFSSTLSDGSVWVFLLGDSTERFVHIHPARHSPHTFRIKANSLKTVLALCFEGVGVLGKEVVNRVRVEDLGLSAVKEVTVGELFVKYRG